ncbi:DUF192 domain-containing protein [Streptomyces sp. NPDC093094]|uniref:DUF192 domain-containing protein n=1 Tax=Streptomyces sp. NPDC093094 TaxID=3366026 RepID=UPI00382A532C
MGRDQGRGRGGWRDGPGRLTVVRGAEPAGAAPPPIPLEIATSYRARTKGLLGRDEVTGALLLSPAGSIHTFGMRIPIDVAYLDRNLRILALRTMPPNRLGLPRLRARHVLEAAAGSMRTWGLRAGTEVEVETAAP